MFLSIANHRKIIIVQNYFIIVQYSAISYSLRVYTLKRILAIQTRLIKNINIKKIKNKRKGEKFFTAIRYQNGERLNGKRLLYTYIYYN